MKTDNRHITPPRLAERFLLWFLKGDLAEEVLGDLDEKFYVTLDQKSKQKARRNYWYQVFNYLRPFAFKFFRSQHSNNITMFKHNLIISFRHIFRNKSHSLINIGGLAIGMTVAMLIGLWVSDELSFNKNHDNYDRITKVARFHNWNGERVANTVHTTGMGTVLKSSFPDYFDHVVLVRARIENRVIAFDDKKFTQSGYFIQDGGPEMLSLKMKYGSWNGLKEMNSIMLSESVALKLFGDKDPVNKMVKMDARWDLMVTGVYKDLPNNSEFSQATYFAPITRYLDGWASLNIWDNYNMYIYAQLQDNVDIDRVSALITDEIVKSMPEDPSNEGIEFFLHPMKKWHLHSEFNDGFPVTSKNLQFVWLYGVIGVFVLILACINFMNLSTARSEKRAKEVGIRKTIGSIRRQLIDQFYIESLLHSLFGFGLALLLLMAMLPWFNETAGKDIMAPWNNTGFWFLSTGFMLITALLAGSYPAMYLSSFKPVKALKGTFSAGRAAAIPRKILVVFQFTISIALIVGTITVNNQIQLAKNRPVGYSPEGMLSLRPASPYYRDKFPLLKEELKRTGVVTDIASSNYPVVSTLGWNGGFGWEGKDPSFNESFNTISISHDYASVVGMEFIAGRNFSREFPTDINAILINRSALEIMQLENPIGQVLRYDPGWRTPGNYTIIGVVEDMIKGSPFESTDQSVMFLNHNYPSWLYIRLNPTVSVSEAIPKVEAVFSEILPAAPFDFKFADADYYTKFEAEERMANLAGFLSTLAILISCLGLFGLASYVAEQRTKEIGIRKVLGASVSNLWRLLSKDFAILILLACLIATPIAYAVLDGWLKGYEEFRTPLHWWIFVIGGSSALIVTMITVSFQAIKAAIANPVTSLRSE